MTMETLGEIIQRYFPGSTAEQMDDFIWSCTGYPGFFESDTNGGRLAEFEAHCKSAAERSGADIWKAIDQAYEDLDEAMSTREQ